jgi:hypothetical protein
MASGSRGFVGCELGWAMMDRVESRIGVVGWGDWGRREFRCGEESLQHTARWSFLPALNEVVSELFSRGRYCMIISTGQNWMSRAKIQLSDTKMPRHA